MEFTKTCTKCGHLLPVLAFGHHKTGKDGLRSMCRPCINRQINERRRNAPPKEPTVAEKACSMCKLVLPARSFYRRASTPTGLTEECKLCRKTYELQKHRVAREALPSENVNRDGDKRCVTCRQDVARVEFHYDPKQADGLASECRFCRGARAKVKRARAPVSVPETKTCKRCGIECPCTAFYRSYLSKDGLASWCKPCEQEYRGRAYIANKEQRLKYGLMIRRGVRSEVFQAYGGPEPACACCGEMRPEFLAIDHVGGGGNQHRKEIGKAAGDRFYAWLKDNDFPPGFRVLCHNCNCSHGFYGYCPHDIEQAVAAS